MPGILGRKVGMTRIIQDDGTVVPVTVLQCQPQEIVQVKTNEKDGYTAAVVGFEKLAKPSKTKKFAKLAEFALDAAEVGKAVTVQDFDGVASVKLTGTSKGRGFAGVIKRHHFSRGPETHGSHHHRQPGSASGMRSGTGRVKLGKRYPGHMGSDSVTISTKLVRVDTENNLLIVKGAVPGAAGSIVKVVA